MTYVSCSPYMVPVAWLAAAQAEIKGPRQGKHGEATPKASRANTRKAVTVAARGAARATRRARKRRDTR
jgi:hypothetical protein